ncbi:MAG: AGE family epimerase/isomerase, partial [Pseudomonadota bacterium]
ERGLDFLLAACRRDDGLYGCVVDLHKRELIDPTPDLYDTAFVLLALSRAHGLLGATGLGTAIDALLDGLDRAFARAPGEGFRERLPPPAERRQNPHMHLFESCLTLAAASGDAAHRRRADDLLAFVRERFIDLEAGVVWERVDDGGKTLARSFEPGHSFEWVWLLAEHQRVLGTAAGLDDIQSRLYQQAVRVVGDAPRIGLEATLEAMPPEHGARLWSMTEALRAHLEMGRRGDAAASERAVATCNALFRDWLEPAIAGGWHDHFDGEGRMVSADMPASSLYHIMTAIEALDIAGR